jgi:ectoine hydroxylase-related dioxygenase (phytanoyl-CoA dioxygenase family)
MSDEQEGCLSNLERDGFAIAPAVMNADTIHNLSSEIEKLFTTIPPAGIRALADKVFAIRPLAQSRAVRDLIEPILGVDARMVRSILFSKNEQANWHVAWHQDLAIAVKVKADLSGYTNWSLKEGVVHVQPPIEILQRMLTIRLHLDDADETNGALWVSPGTHRMGRLAASEAATVAAQNGKHLCSVNAGDALLFRPMLLHASRKSTSNRPRRVIHLEYAAADLPEPLVWSEL